MKERLMKESLMTRGAGFTLIEVMVVVLIVCLLMLLALPSYQAHIVRAKRAQAQATLFELMQQQERYYSQNNRYLEFSADSTDPHEKRFRWWSGTRAADSAYQINAASCPDQSIADCVQLSALPGGERVDTHFADRECGTLSLRSDGVRLASGDGLHCWP